MVVSAIGQHLAANLDFSNVPIQEVNLGCAERLNTFTRTYTIQEIESWALIPVIGILVSN